MGHDYHEAQTAGNTVVTRGYRFAVTMTHDSMTLSPAVPPPYPRSYGRHTTSADAFPALSTAFTTMPSTPLAGTSTVRCVTGTSR